MAELIYLKKYDWQFYLKDAIEENPWIYGLSYYVKYVRYDNFVVPSDAYEHIAQIKGKEFRLASFDSYDKYQFLPYRKKVPDQITLIQYRANVYTLKEMVWNLEDGKRIVYSSNNGWLEAESTLVNSTLNPSHHVI